MNTSLNHTNRTMSEGNSLDWSWMFSATLITSITGSLSNVFILAQIAKRRLRSPFMVYVTILTVTNAVIAIIYQPFLIVIHYFPDHRNAVVCDIGMYFERVFAGIVFYAHLLATANQLWAIILPVSYKNHHTVKRSLIWSFSAVVVVHIGCLPFYIMNIGNYIHTAKGVRCLYPSRVNETNVAVIPEMVFYVVPAFFMIVTYPLLAVVISCRRAPGYRSSKNKHTISILLLMTFTMLFSFGLTKVVLVLGIAGMGRYLELPVMVAATASLCQPTLDALIFVTCLKDLQVGIPCRGANWIQRQSNSMPMASGDEHHGTYRI